VTADPIAAAIAHFKLEVIEMVTPAESYSSTVRLLTLTNGERLVLKLPYTRLKLARESAALQALADLPVPRVVNAWVPEDEAPGALLLSHLPGDVMQTPTIPDLVRATGTLLARLHQHRLPAYGEVHEVPSKEAPGWWEMMHARFELWLRTCTGVLPESLLARLRDVHDTLNTDLPAPDGPCWVHADFRPGNVLVADGVITGLIDFESARGGSADLDFVKVSHVLFDAQPESRTAFLAGYDAVRPHPEIDRTLPYYRLHNAVGGLAWCIRRTDIHDPFFRENYEVVEQVLASHDNASMDSGQSGVHYG
jgi:aminoglycoside phosphotransferase (APT) family kinase protein